MALPSLADVMQFCFAGITMDATYGLVAVGFNIIFNATGAVNDARGVRVAEMPLTPAVLRRLAPAR